LVELGCTDTQAKVYIALVKLGSAKAKTIAELSQIPRQEVYRELSELQDKGLIEKIISSPTRFKVAPIGNCLSSLLKGKTSELCVLQEKVDRLVQKLSNDRETFVEEQEATQYILISEREALLNSIKHSIKTTQKSVDIMCTNQVLSQALFYLSEAYVSGLKRGVKIRVITNNSRSDNSQPEIIMQSLIADHNFQFKCISDSLLGQFALFDKKEVFVACFPSGNFAEHPSLWSNSENLSKIMSSCFELLWKETSKVCSKGKDMRPRI
jgi:sugar-specific transcriptional regulator TrmB